MRLRNPLKRYTIADLERNFRKKAALDDIHKLRAMVNIAVIDDQLFVHLDGIRDQSFNISQVGNVSNISQIQNFEIIACDLRGVGIRFNENLQGAAIIQEIKRVYPYKYVIAYSGSFNRSSMARIAGDCSDIKISKSADLDKWVNILDSAILESINPVEKWKKLHMRMVSLNLSSNEIRSIEHSYCKSYILSNKKYIEKAENDTSISEDARAIIQGLISSAIWATLTL